MDYPTGWMALSMATTRQKTKPAIPAFWALFDA
jgi:hypothetical protein